MSDDDDDELPSFLRCGPPPTPRAFRLALVQLSNVNLDKGYNLRHAEEAIRRAAIGADGSKSADLVVLPDHFSCPNNIELFTEHAEIIGFNFDPDVGESYDIATSRSQTVKMLSKSARQAGIWLIAGSVPERVGALIHSTTTVFNPAGGLVSIHRKSRVVEAHDPNNLVVAEDGTQSPGKSVPHVDTDFGRISLGLSWDVRFPEPIMIARHQECLATIYPGAFNLDAGPAHWHLLQRTRAAECQMYIVMCCPARDMWATGTGASFQAWQRTCVVDPFGVVVGESDEHEGVLYADIDPQLVSRARHRAPVAT